MGATPGAATPPKPCIHIGMPKTASTTLQNALLAHHPDVFYLGMYSGKLAREYYRTQVPGVAVRDAEIAALLDELLWDGRQAPNLAKSRDIHARRIQSAIDSHLVPVWSWESMVEDRHEVQRIRAANMRNVFGPCKVLVVIRNPVDLIKSIYLQQLWRNNIGGGWARGRPPYAPSLDSWLNLRMHLRGRAPRAHLEFAVAIEIFADAFGQENVGIFLFEQLKEDQERFMRRICEFVGIDGDRGVELTQGRELNLRWRQDELDELHRIHGSLVRSVRFQFSDRRARRAMLGLDEDDPARLDRPAARAEMTEQTRAKIVQQTRAGNRRLAERWHLPLEEYGYPI